MDEQTGADIVVRAVVDESNTDGQTRVRAGIFKEGTGVQSDSFSATLVFDPESAGQEETVESPDAPLPLIPETDLYRPTLLFQGPRFQGIQAIWEIRQSGEKTGTALFSSQPTPPEERSTAAFGEETSFGLCLGDAFFTDTLLQSAALLVPAGHQPAGIHRSPGSARRIFQSRDAGQGSCRPAGPGERTI